MYNIIIEFFAAYFKGNEEIFLPVGLRDNSNIIVRKTIRCVEDYAIEIDINRYYYINNKVIVDIDKKDFNKLADNWIVQYNRKYKNISLDNFDILVELMNYLFDIISRYNKLIIKLIFAPKTVYDSNYIISTDNIPSKVLDKLEMCEGIKDQKIEWEKFGFNIGNKKLKEIKDWCLPIDTKYFPHAKKDIIFSIEDIDEKLDGWLICGDNLQVINTIRNKFKDRIQLVYVDPPYRTGNSESEMGYKDDYKLYEWIVMMYNRLILFHQILKDEGRLTVSIDYREFNNILNLCESIFKQNNKERSSGLIQYITWKSKRPSINANSEKDRYLPKTHEYILCYAKDISKYIHNSIHISRDIKEDIKRYNMLIVNKGEEILDWNVVKLEDVYKRYYFYNNSTFIDNLRSIIKNQGLRKKDIKDKVSHYFKSDQVIKSGIDKTTDYLYKCYKDNKNIDNDVMIQNIKLHIFRTKGIYEFLINNAHKIFKQIYNPKKPSKDLKELMKKSEKQKNKFSGDDKNICYNGNLVQFYDVNFYIDSQGNIHSGSLLTDLWDDTEYATNKQKEVKGKKPDIVINRILNMSINNTNSSNNIVLDGFLGSGTTISTCKELNLKFIGIEYKEELFDRSLLRLKETVYKLDKSKRSTFLKYYKMKTLEEEMSLLVRRNDNLFVDQHNLEKLINISTNSNNIIIDKACFKEWLSSEIDIFDFAEIISCVKGTFITKIDKNSIKLDDRTVIEIK